MRKIDPADLVPMDIFIGEPVAVDIVYADAGHGENIFGIRAYHTDARMILHRDMARIVIAAARTLYDSLGWTLILKDGLRPVEAQGALLQTDIVRANPHWLQEPRLLSPPGAGAHPRGMAIDVAARREDGARLDFGTVFDTMTEQSAREYQNLPSAILDNRRNLEQAFTHAGRHYGLPILPLPSEWWDFRFTRDHYSAYAPIEDVDLPGNLKMTMGRRPDTTDEQDGFARLAKDILLSL